MNAFRSTLLSLAALAALATVPAAGAAGFVDPLDEPSQMSPLAAKSLLQGVARAGPRLVAVGQRGHIVYSNDAGATWQQAKVPVSSDLTAVYFPSEQKGWAVGHDGVILNTTDGGLTWTLQLDGRRANERLVEHMQHAVDADPQSTELKGLLDEAKRFKEQGADKPFLAVWFADDQNGYVVGAYNLIFHTTDGGKNWQPLFDRTDNPKLMNFYGIRPAADGLYIVGEAGVVLKYDAEAKRFRALKMPYAGSYFGVIGDKTAVVVYGLRGNVWRSGDNGKSWQKVEAGLPATVTAGAVLAKGTLALADFGGRVVVSDDGGRTFKPVPVAPPTPISGIADAGNDRLAKVGVRGVSVAELPAR
jgi:photosystem II stability/assembly factor-like uncharacterized protein